MTTAVSDLQSAGHSHERRRLAALLSGGGPQPLADPVLDQLLDPLPDDFAHLRQVILGEIEFGKNLLAYLVLQLLSVSVVCPAFQAFLQNLVRSEERRVGKECVSTCRSRWSQLH